MLLAAILFAVAGISSGVYPGGSGWFDHGGFAWLTYVFGLVNVVVALWIWRGSERGLVTRIGLAALFLAAVIALAVSQPSDTSFVIYGITAVIELVIFLDAVRVWRLGRGADSRELDAMFSLDTPLPVAAPQRTIVVPPFKIGAHHAAAPLSPRLTWTIGLTSLALAGVLVADGVVSGFVPGGVEWGLYGKSSGWLVYLFALVVLVVPMRAVHGSTLSLRLLLATGLIVLVERPFSPLVLGDTGVSDLALHVLAALIALGLALASVAGLRQVDEARRATSRMALGHATGAK